LGPVEVWAAGRPVESARTSWGPRRAPAGRPRAGLVPDRLMLDRAGRRPAGARRRADGPAPPGGAGTGRGPRPSPRLPRRHRELGVSLANAKVTQHRALKLAAELAGPT